MSLRADARRVVSRLRRVRPPVTESVLAWCAGRADASCVTLRPQEVVVRRLPRTLDGAVDPRFVAIAGDRYVVPEKYLARIGGARLVGDTGLVVLPDGSFASEVTFAPAHLRDLPAYFTRLSKQVHPMDGAYFSLLSLWAHVPNYYHWLHDAMLRLHLAIDHLGEDVRFIVPAGLAPFQLETLRVLGIGADRLRPFTGEEPWELETLYFSAPTTSSGSNSPTALRWFRDACWSAYGLAPTRGSRRIFISRRNTRWRRIVNEA
jgi:capsular polysaccharide biosynthesis protein